MLTTAKKPSVNADGTIVTIGDMEYRWRNGTILVREGEGDLRHIAWHDVPEDVRHTFSECG